MALAAGILFATANLYAGNEDLIVNGNMGVGTTTVPEASLAVKGKLPEAVNTGEDGVKAVSYTEIIPALIEAMKEQQKQITGQQKRIEELEKKVAQLK